MVKSGNATGGVRDRSSRVTDSDLLQMDLVDNAGARRKHGQTVERLLRPFQKPIALAVALELALEVYLFGVG